MKSGRRIFIHEAGHGLAAILRGMPVSKLESDRACIPGLADADPAAAFEVYVAGAAAERVFLWGQRNTLDLMSSVDLACAKQHYRAAFNREPKTTEPRFMRAIAAVEQLMEKHRSAVCKLARELQRKGELSGEAVLEVLRWLPSIHLLETENLKESRRRLAEFRVAEAADAQLDRETKRLKEWMRRHKERWGIATRTTGPRSKRATTAEARARNPAIDRYMRLIEQNGGIETASMRGPGCRYVMGAQQALEYRKGICK